MLTHCPICDQQNFSKILHIPEAPVHCNCLYSHRVEALAAPVGEIQLLYCESCGHIFNRAFNDDLVAYDLDYENSLFHSTRFREYASEIAAALIERHNLRDKSILEIGCGGGDFLKLICEMGKNYGRGLDPGYDPSRGVPSSSTLNFERSYFTAAYLDAPLDFIVCRHVLEHLAAPAELVALAHTAAVPIFFEVPNALYTLRDLGIWDVIYEHPSFFTPSSLQHIFERNQFTITRLDEVYGNQFLTLEAHPTFNQTTKRIMPPISDTGELVTAFKARRAEKVAFWEQRLHSFTGSTQKIVLWGAGSKGVTFLNSFGKNIPIEYIVDINPHKQGLYIPRTGQKIISPEALNEFQPDGIILLNPLYQDEIRQQVESLGLQIEIFIA